MENRELEVELELDTIDDFELEQPMYEVWLLGRTYDQEPTDYEELLVSYSDPEQAIDFAKTLTRDDLKNYNVPTKSELIEVVVETVVEIDDEGSYTNVGTLYSKLFRI